MNFHINSAYQVVSYRVFEVIRLIEWHHEVDIERDRRDP